MKIVVTFRPDRDGYVDLIGKAFESAKRFGYTTVMVGPQAFGADKHLPYRSESPLMDWILEAQRHFIGSDFFDENAVLFSPDAIINRRLDEVFDVAFDAGFTLRPHKTMPINNGVIFLKPKNWLRLLFFWEDCIEICRHYPKEIRDWYGDQMALWHALEGGKDAGLAVERFDCRTHNSSEVHGASSAYVVHYKGKRKAHMRALV